MLSTEMLEVLIAPKPGMIVGEIDAGNGYFSLKLARRIGPSGKVYANDIVEDFLAEVRDRSKQQNLSNIETILGTETDPRLPAGRLDMVFMTRVLHDLTKPVQVLEKITASLQPGAKVIVVETEDKEQDGKRSLQTRRQFLDVISRSPFWVDKIDKSLPNPRSVVFILVPKKIRRLAAPPAPTRQELRSWHSTSFPANRVGSCLGIERTPGTHPSDLTHKFYICRKCS